MLFLLDFIVGTVLCVFTPLWAAVLNQAYTNHCTTGGIPSLKKLGSERGYLTLMSVVTDE